ncbi:N-acetylneuraminate synthase family protein [Alsobacter sp. R-9]
MTFIIAEAAQGHEGNETYALHLIKAAAQAGADAVKFQLVIADDLAEPDYEYYPWYKKVEFTEDQWIGLSGAAKSLGIKLIMDVFGSTGARIVRRLDVHAVKLHAADFFNDELIQSAYEAAPLVILSSAGILLDELQDKIEWLRKRDLLARTILFCGYQAEPTPIEKTSLGRLVALRALAPEARVGFMDHTRGDGPDSSIVSAMAIALDVDYVEKHLTIDRFMKFDSFVSALTPSEFAAYVEQMRRAETVNGSYKYELLPEELVYRDKYIKKLIFTRDLVQGSLIEPGAMTLKRTGRIGAGEGFHNPAEVVGRRLVRSVKAGDAVLGECFE